MKIETKHFTQRRKEQKNQRRKELSCFFAPSVFLYFAPLRERFLINVCGK
jgi:hypothetical protein